MIKLRNILNELGDAGIKPFPYTPNFRVQKTEDYINITLKFKDNLNRNIEIGFDWMEEIMVRGSDENIGLPKNYFGIYYGINGKYGSNNDEKTVETGQYYLKLLSTLVSIVKDFVKKYNPDGLAIIKTFEDRNEKDTKFNKQKERMYITWLTQALPNYQLRMEGDHIFFDKKKLNEIKLIPNPTPKMVYDLTQEINLIRPHNTINYNSFVDDFGDILDKFIPEFFNNFVPNKNKRNLYKFKEIQKLNKDELTNFYIELLSLKNKYKL